MKASEWRLGISCSAHLSRELMEEYAENGVSAMEISVTPKTLAKLDWVETAKNARATGVELWSLHLPFYPAEQVNISAVDPEIRALALQSHTEYLKKAGNAGVKIAVVHPSSGVIAASEDRDERIRLAQASLAALCEAAAHEGMTIAVENMTRTGLGNRYSEMLRMLEADERLRFVFDTNHPLFEDPCDYLRACVHRMATIHVSDYDGLNEKHWLPYEGIIDWKKLVSILEDGGYAGPWMYEVDFECPKTIERRRLTAADFHSNADAVLGGRIPEILGKPIESECSENAYLTEHTWFRG